MSKTLPLVTLPAPSLRERSLEVDPTRIGTPEFQTLLDDMIKTMIDDNGVGIAAVQVGKNLRAFIVDEPKTGPKPFINPEVTPLTEKTVDSEEGCLSVPGTFGIVKRSQKVRVSALDRHARRVSFVAKGFMAIVFQHECDHLNGILFIDKAERMTKTKGTSVRV